MTPEQVCEIASRPRMGYIGAGFYPMSTEEAQRLGLRLDTCPQFTLAEIQTPDYNVLLGGLVAILQVGAEQHGKTVGAIVGDLADKILSGTFKCGFSLLEKRSIPPPGDRP